MRPVREGKLGTWIGCFGNSARYVDMARAYFGLWRVHSCEVWWEGWNLHVEQTDGLRC